MRFPLITALTAVCCCWFVAADSAIALTQDNGGTQPGTSYPGGKPPIQSSPAGGGTTPGQNPPKPKPEPKPKPKPLQWRAKILPDGKAWTSPGAPLALRQMVEAGNRIVGKPYLWGGGHVDWESRGYDCSGAVSYVLHGAGLLDWPMTSGDLISWGLSGAGRWVTVYTHKTHVFLHLAGIRLDTSWTDDPSGQRGVRWRVQRTHRKGFRVRHPKGL